MKTLNPRNALVVALAVSLSAPAFAQDEENPIADDGDSAAGGSASFEAGFDSSDMEIDAAASEQAWNFGVAPRIGVTIPTSKLGAMVVGGLEIDYALPVLDGKLLLALDGAITRPTHDRSVSDPRIGGEGDYTLKTTEFKLGLDVIYRFFGPDKRLVPYAGIGPILHMLKTKETRSFAPGTNTEQDTNIGFEILGGADFRLGPGMILGEVRVVYSDLDHLYTGNSNAGNVMISAGYRFVF